MAPMRKLLLFSIGDVGSTMSGPGIRYYHFARELAKVFDVTLMVPNESDLAVEGVKFVSVAGISARELNRVLEPFDVVVAQKLPLATMRHLARTGKRVIYDLYVPMLSEDLGMLDVEQTNPASVLFHQTSLLRQRYALATGNAFICASERQRDFWLGMLGALGRVDLLAYREDRNLRKLIDVVPFGLPAEPPSSSGSVLKGIYPGIREQDRVLLWAGGIWNWFDPLTVIRAVERISQTRDDVKLLFLGLKHPQVPQMAMADRAIELARSSGLLDRFVFFNAGWVPYEARQSFLLEADLGVSAHFDTLETRFSFRTRVLDYLWAGLPTITTRGDVLADLVAERNLGRAVDFEDVDGWVRAIEELPDDEGEYRRIRENIRVISPEFAWSKVVAPLVRLAQVSGSHVDARRSTTGMSVDDVLLRLRISLLLGGSAGLLKRQAAKLSRKAHRIVP